MKSEEAAPRGTMLRALVSLGVLGMAVGFWGEGERTCHVESCNT